MNVKEVELVNAIEFLAQQIGACAGWLLRDAYRDAGLAEAIGAIDMNSTRIEELCAALLSPAPATQEKSADGPGAEIIKIESRRPLC